MIKDKRMTREYSDDSECYWRKPFARAKMSFIWTGWKVDSQKIFSLEWYLNREKGEGFLWEFFDNESLFYLKQLFYFIKHFFYWNIFETVGICAIEIVNEYGSGWRYRMELRRMRPHVGFLPQFDVLAACGKECLLLRKASSPCSFINFDHFLNSPSNFFSG